MQKSYAYSDLVFQGKTGLTKCIGENYSVDRGGRVSSPQSLGSEFSSLPPVVNS